MLEHLHLHLTARGRPRAHLQLIVLVSAGLLAAGTVAPASPAAAAIPPAETTQLVGVATDGTIGNGQTGYGSDVSFDGRYIAFISFATTLVSDDTNGTYDIFRRDRQDNATVRVSVASSGTQSDGQSTRPSISDDGRYVAFTSTATNLGGSGSMNDVYVRDVVAGTTTWIGAGYGAMISGDGSMVAYTGLDIPRQIFIRPLAGGPLELVSVAAGGGPADDLAQLTQLSSNGRLVVFTSSATNLVAPSIPTQQHVWIRDRFSATTALVDASSAGAPADGPSHSGVIGLNGATAAFWSYGNLDGSTEAGYFVRDLPSGTPVRVGSGIGNNIDMSADGRYVTFDSYGANGTPDTTTNTGDVFRVDRVTGVTQIVGVDNTGGQPPNGALVPAISGDGTAVVFNTGNPLVTEDTNQELDLYVRQMAPATPLSVQATTTAGGTVSTGGTTSSVKPVDVAVTTPVAGTVTITATSTATQPPPTGYTFLNQQVAIEAPVATATAPLVLTFIFDASIALNHPVEVFRNGALVPSCTGTPGTASPDPCATAPTINPLGDVTVTVYTSHASIWNFALAPAASFRGFYAPIDMGGVTNTVKGGSIVPVTFNLRTAFGVEITDPARITLRSATSFICSTNAVSQDAIEITAATTLSLRFDGKRFIANWKTPRTAGTCLTLTASAGDAVPLTAIFLLK